MTAPTPEEWEKLKAWVSEQADFAQEMAEAYMDNEAMWSAYDHEYLAYCNVEDHILCLEDGSLDPPKRSKP